MAGRLNGENRKMRDAVSAKLKRAQTADGMSDSRRAAQNKRVADRIKGKKQS